jgi:hypothetical protein
LERGGTLLRQGGAGGCEKKLKKTDINLTLVKGIPESPRVIDLFSYLSRYIRE